MTAPRTTIRSTVRTTTRLTRSIVGTSALSLALVAGGCNQAEDDADQAAAGADAMPAADGQAAGDADVTSGVGSAAGSTTGAALTLGGVRLVFPADWRVQEPTSRMRAAQAAIPAPAGVDAQPADLAIFTGIGGGIDFNIDRWAAQFGSDPNAQTSRETLTVDGVTVHHFMGRGTFDSGLPGSPGPQEDTMVLGFVADNGTDKPFIVKATGPAATLGPARDAWDAFVRSIDYPDAWATTDAAGS
jgi:hypothetical protein